MSHFTLKLIASGLLACAIVSCGKESDTKGQEPTVATTLESSPGNAETADTSSSQWTVTSDMNVPAEHIGTDENLAAVLDTVDIPYPLYPNGSKYRTGGENGLKVVLFQTEDSFEKVDAFFQSQSNLPRLSMMNDYVRYSADLNDHDPWETTKPGIVIHQFNDADERQAVGADGSAKTNIIMSFQ